MCWDSCTAGLSHRVGALGDLGNNIDFTAAAGNTHETGALPALFSQAGGADPQH